MQRPRDQKQYFIFLEFNLIVRETIYGEVGGK